MLMQKPPSVDPVFPTLALASDPDAVATLLKGELAAAGFPAQELKARMERVRLKPGRKALFGYHLEGTAKDGAPIDQQLMLTLWPDAELDRLAIVATTPQTKPGFGPSRLDSSALGGSAWFFPNDRKVAGIARLIEEAKSLGSKIEIVHYVPEQGCTIRVDTVGGQLYGKARVDDRCANAARIALQASAQGHAGIRLARVTGYDSDCKIMWQEAVPGSPLTAEQVLTDPYYWARQISKAISAFQKIKPPCGLSSYDGQSVLETLARRAKRTGKAFPKLAMELDILTAKLGSIIPAPSQLVLAHCDLHPANLLWDRQSFALIDLDSCAMASAALDHASLTAAIAQKLLALQYGTDFVWHILNGMREAGAPNASARQQREFYWYLAACLTSERLYRCATRRKAAHTEMPAQILELALHAADEAEKARV